MSPQVYGDAERAYRIKRVKEFSAEEVIAFCRAFSLPLVWFYLPPHPWTVIVARNASGDDQDVALTGDDLLSLIFPRIDDPMLSDLGERTERLFSAVAAQGPRRDSTSTYLQYVYRQNNLLRSMIIEEFKDLDAVPGQLEDAARRVRKAVSAVANDLMHEGIPTPAGQPPIVAAIVTSPRGVLVGRRNDGRPPWTFIAGEVEPGEQPEDAAVREVKEETGLEVRAGQVIGERDHPATGRHMIYLSAAPVRGTDVFVGDEAELAEVRWVSLAEADELLPGMFGPAREYLVSELSEGER